MKKNRFKFSLFIVTIVACNVSCSKFLDIDPPKNSASLSQIFSDDLLATSALTSVYSNMASTGFFSGDQNSITTLAGLSADELLTYNSSLDGFYANELLSIDFTIEYNIWQKAYQFIYTSNAILNGLNVSPKLSNSTKSQLQGEAKFIRAFTYFYLVNLFGDVPIVLNTDYRLNSTLARSSAKEVYDQIISDLIDAENLLSVSYPSVERIRPNKWAAKALLARVYLYNNRWTDAINKSSEVIGEKASYELLNDLDKIFLKNSKEAIWQLMPGQGSNTNEGGLFILVSTPWNVSLSRGLENQFDTNDIRRAKWIGQYTTDYAYPWKYKIRTTSNGIVNEYSMMIRLAEMYLVRAEAKIQEGNISGGIADLNLVRQRPNPDGTFSNPVSPISTTLQKNDALNALYKERRLELFCEQGHRWLDLKRTKLANSTLAPVKGAKWSESDILYPIPNSEILKNPNLNQNPGY